MSKRIGILTSGGDCAGLNAALRAATLRAHQYGWEILGVRQGTTGLFQRPVNYVSLSPDMFTGTVLRTGGTMLGSTNRGDPFAYPMPDGTTKDITEGIAQGYHELGLDAMIGIGGDGSFKILRGLAQKGGWNLVGIPKTIDNDLGCTENSIGFMTAAEVATEALDRLQPTAASHDRIMVLELMGRDAGHIALYAGIAGGADVILIPEIPYRIEHVARHIQKVKDSGRNFALVVISEAVKMESGETSTLAFEGGRPRYGGIGHYMSDRLEKMTDAESRFIVLGHLQRGGQPIASDRVMASVFGVRAVDLIAEGSYDRMVTWQNRQVVDVPIESAIERYKAVELDSPLVKTARGLGICLGDS
ncbi:MAG: ATP-dependent 6-phosphofructokinase [bacterium]|nr:ATP-dependent 6-phosphofructokinase [bacterium]